jgi:hypothetical protein
MNKYKKKKILDQEIMLQVEKNQTGNMKENIFAEKKK